MSLLINRLCVVVMIFASPVAYAQSTAPSESVSVAAFITRAQQAYDANDFHRAMVLLENVTGNTDQEKTEILFIIGLSALNAAVPLDDSEQRNSLLTKAVDAFYQILVNHPKLTRVRLELARAFFEQGNDNLAKNEFERVLSGDLPPAVVSNINRFLFVIQSRHRWDSYFMFSVVPESRVVQNRTVLLNFNGNLLPFTLDDTPRSGHGLDMSTGSAYTHPLSEKWVLVYDANVRRLEYAGHQFDRSELRVGFRPKVTFSQGTDLYLNASFQSNFQQNDKHTNNVRSFGFGGQHTWTPRFSSSSAVSTATDNNDNGPDDSFSLSGKYRISPTIFASSTVIFARTRPRMDSLRSRRKQLEFRAGFLLPRGFTANALASVQWSRYNSNLLVLDGTKRESRINTLQLGLLNRSVTFFGFSPRVSVIQQKRDTNYQLDNYRSTSYQLNFQKQF